MNLSLNRQEVEMTFFEKESSLQIVQRRNGPGQFHLSPVQLHADGQGSGIFQIIAMVNIVHFTRKLDGDDLNLPFTLCSEKGTRDSWFYDLIGDQPFCSGEIKDARFGLCLQTHVFRADPIDPSLGFHPDLWKLQGQEGNLKVLEVIRSLETEMDPRGGEHIGEP